MSIHETRKRRVGAWELVAAVALAASLLPGATALGVEVPASATLFGGNGEDPPPTCTGDVVPDGIVNVVDLIVLMAQWGPCPPTRADCNGDGEVDVEDLLTVLACWGPCP